MLVQVLGLEQHADAFEREEVELDLVCSLSNADLLELGIEDAGVVKIGMLHVRCEGLRSMSMCLSTECVCTNHGQGRGTPSWQPHLSWQRHGGWSPQLTLYCRFNQWRTSHHEGDPGVRMHAWLLPQLVRTRA